MGTRGRPAAEMKGRIVADRYRLERRLGSGAMGEVWLAEHLTLGSRVAVKLIHAEAAQNQRKRARFDREARIAAHLRSAHIVSVLDHGTTSDDVPFMVMEYLTGESLRDRLRARSRLSPTETGRIVSHVCRAMTQAHHAGLVHRDLKPDNIFIARQDDDEIVKVLDFGVAKATDFLAGEGMDPTKTGTLLGTPFYMSPEQAQGMKTVDYRSDIWAMAVVVFECLTGRRPFSAHGLGPLIAKITIGPIVAPSSIAPDNVTPEIDSWMQRALERDPLRRFRSAQELAETFLVAAGTIDSIERSLPSDAPPAGALGPGATVGIAEATGTVATEDEAAADDPWLGDSETTEAGTVIVGEESESDLEATTAMAPSAGEAAEARRILGPKASPAQTMAQQAAGSGRQDEALDSSLPASLPMTKPSWLLYVLVVALVSAASIATYFVLR